MSPRMHGRGSRRAIAQQTQQLPLPRRRPIILPPHMRRRDADARARAPKHLHLAALERDGIQRHARRQEDGDFEGQGQVGGGGLQEQRGGEAAAVAEADDAVVGFFVVVGGGGGDVRGELGEGGEDAGGGGGVEVGVEGVAGGDEGGDGGFHGVGEGTFDEGVGV